jgi:hypothetical protein
MIAMGVHGGPREEPPFLRCGVGIAASNVSLLLVYGIDDNTEDG